MNIIVIANCHVQPLAYLLGLHPAIGEVISIPVHLIGTEHYDKPVKKIEEASLEFYVLQFPGLVDGIIFSKDARLKFKKIINITNIYFMGFHPDCCYIGGMGVRVVSPLGDYHSKLCYLSFIKGYTVEKCFELFNGGVFEVLGYNKQWEDSSNDLLRRDDGMEVKFAGEFLHLSEDLLTLLTFNHPTTLVFYKFVEKITDYLGLGRIPIPIEAAPNFLYNNAVWPVYSDLKFLGGAVSFNGYYFKSPDSSGRGILSLQQFIDSSYASYAKIGIENINKPYFHDFLLERV